MGGYVWYVYIWNRAELQLVVEKEPGKFNDPETDSIAHMRLNFVDIPSPSTQYGTILYGVVYLKFISVYFVF